MAGNFQTREILWRRDRCWMSAFPSERDLGVAPVRSRKAVRVLNMSLTLWSVYANFFNPYRNR